MPTSRATRVTSSANDDSWSTIVLTVDFSSRISPRASTVIFCAQVALGHRRGHRGDVADLAGQVGRHVVHVVGQVAPRTGDALDLRPGRPACPPNPPRGPPGSPRRRTTTAGRPSCSRSSSARAISPRASTVIFCDRSPFATAVDTWAMLRTWSVRLAASWLTFSVRSRQVPDTPRHLRLTAQPALGAHLAGHPGHLVGERRQLVDHRVDGVLQLQDLALRGHGDLLRQVALRHRGGRPGRCCGPGWSGWTPSSSPSR